MEAVGGEQIPGMGIFENRDSRKQLLAGSRYLLYKSREKWTRSQRQRVFILFAQYPDLEKA
ncbi:transposase [Chryseobacterium sp. SSA4.19]|uniref:transposase n=1 Tax=Chryseobacterium sp. SSA4.19 TaxID=2919915 RepID=UPI001F4F49F9|nr:transposase [Chryseobacterium sp. SSA4.19]MCJ8152251.1 transposase [Chryseobacterium sp. SSA4.19]